MDEEEEKGRSSNPEEADEDRLAQSTKTQDEVIDIGASDEACTGETKCPGNTETVGTQCYEIKTIPYQWWRLALSNMLQLKFQGRNFLTAGIQNNNSTVFKLKLNEYRIMVCDSVGMQTMFDLTKVKRDQGFGSALLNLTMLKQHVPCVFTNDEEHKTRKDFLVSYLGDTIQKLTATEIFETVKLEFEKMESVDFPNAKDAGKYNFEAVIRKAVSNVMAYFVLGEYIEESELIYEWYDRSLKLGLLFNILPNNDAVITNQLYERIEAANKIKELKYKVDTVDLKYEEMLSEIVWSLCYTATGNMKNIVMSCLLCYIRLSETDKELLKQDAEKVFSAEVDTLQELLPTLENIHAFYLEVMRLHPPTEAIFGRAKNNFILESTSGHYQVNENDLLCGYHYIVQRDPELFENPNEFMLNRPLEISEQYNFAFGGDSLEESSSDNHQCPAKFISNNIAKMFVIFFTKCLITPTKEILYTGRNYARLEASDQPLRVSHFSYDK